MAGAARDRRGRSALLAVAVGFHGGLFNIGAEGQFYMGALVAAVVGYAVVGLPMWLHLPLALAAAAAGGAVWGRRRES